MIASKDILYHLFAVPLVTIRQLALEIIHGDEPYYEAYKSLMIAL